MFQSYSRVRKALQATPPIYAALLLSAAAAAAARRQLWFGGGGVPKVTAAAARPARRGSLHLYNLNDFFSCYVYKKTEEVKAIVVVTDLKSR